MSVEYFRINFDDRPHATYFCGETVTGHVALKLRKEIRLKAIEIKFAGKAEVMWSEVKYNLILGTRSTVYIAREAYVDNTVYVLGGKDGDDVTLSPGDYTYNFALILPQALPSSFESKNGHVRYTVKAKIVRPWKSNDEIKVAYTVLCVLDLNNLDNIQVPKTASGEKVLSSGAVTLTATLPFTGYVPGQRVQMLLEVDNKSSSQISVKCKLVQEITLTAKSTTSFTTKSMKARTVMEKEQLGVVGKKGSKNLQSNMVIPPLPASFLRNCNCIDIGYFLEFTGVIPGMHRNITLEIPIVIGMIPLKKHFQSIMATDVQVPSSSAATVLYINPSALSGYDYPDLPPPSYEECVSGKADIRSEDDSKDLQGSTKFTPRYPMYRFQ